MPKNKNDQFLKWSSGGRGVRNRDRRLKFLSNVERDYDTLDFAVHCISSTEGQISQFTQAFYLQNLSNITQKQDNKGRNCLIFKISDTTVLQVPALQAAKLIWIFYCLKYKRRIGGRVLQFNISRREANLLDSSSFSSPLLSFVLSVDLI